MKPLVTLVSLLVFFLPNAAHAIKVPIPGDDNTLTVLVQLQPQAQVAENGTPDGKGYNTDFFLRRVRLYALGNVTKRFTYYFLVDSPNFGKNSDFTSRVLVQEAWAGYQPIDDIFIDVGLSLLPFSHNATQGTTTYNTIDGHGSLYLLQATPTGQPLSNITTRNVGVTFRGYLLDKKLWFRAGVYNGVRGVVSPTLPTLNPNGVPRLAGRVQYSILGTEALPYLQGIYFSTTPILTVGFAADWQSRSIIGVNGVTDFLGLAADVFLEYPTVPDQELIFQVDGYRYPNGNGSTTGASAGAAGTNDAWAGFIEAGYRVGIIEPVGYVDWFHAPADTADRRTYGAGLDFWFNKHTANLKLGYENTVTGNFKNTGLSTFTVQSQLVF